MVFTASLLDAQHIGNIGAQQMENKPASLLVVSLGKTLNGMPPSSCGRQVAGPSSLPVVVPQSNERHANRAWAHTNQKKVKAGIKSITERNAQHQLKNVRVSWITIRKLKNRNTAFLESNRGLYRSSSDKLCNIGAADVIETIQKSCSITPEAKQDDTKFYIDQ